MKIEEQVLLDLTTDESFAITLHKIGRCLLDMNKHDEASEYLQQAIKIDEQAMLHMFLSFKITLSIYSIHFKPKVKKLCFL